MTLDLDDLLADWPALASDLAARVIVGSDGREFVQLRVELGVLQMFPDGRPDGTRYHGMPGAFEFVQHEQRLHDVIAPADLHELRREITQLNYRRIAFTSLAEEAVKREEASAASSHLRHAIRDVDRCVEGLAVLVRHPELVEELASLRLTLVFNRARLLAQLRELEQHYDEAVEAAEAGMAALEETLGEYGLSSEQAAVDPGVVFLRDLSQRMRARHGIVMTLEERLQAAIAAEDFELAAKLHEELQQRQREREGDAR